MAKDSQYREDILIVATYHRGAFQDLRKGVLAQLLYAVISRITKLHTAPKINISLMPDIVSGSRHFVPVIRNSFRSSVYDTLLKFENLPVIVTGRKRILSVKHEIVPDSDR